MFSGRVMTGETGLKTLLPASPPSACDVTLHCHVSGRVMTGETGLKTLLSLRNALILNVKDPTPGTWVIELSAHGAHTVRVTGLSALDFVHGFSLRPTLSLRDTVPQPTRGKSFTVQLSCL